MQSLQSTSSLEDFACDPLASILRTLAGVRGRAVFEARQDQAGNFLIDSALRAAVADPLLGPRVTDLRRAVEAPPGDLGLVPRNSALRAVLGASRLQDSKRDAKQALDHLAGSSYDWSVDSGLVAAVMAVLRLIHRVVELCDRTDFWGWQT